VLGFLAKTASSVALLAGLAMATACSSPPAQTPATVEPFIETLAVQAPQELPPIKGPKSASGYQAILGTPDLGLGPNRIGFVLTSPKGIVKTPTAAVSSVHVPADGSAAQTVETATAEFHLWPYGTRGLYVTSLDFDRAGAWRLDIAVGTAEGVTEVVQVSFEVRESPLAPAVGAKALRSVNRTARDVQRLTQITTGTLLDAELYQTTIADAVASGRPTVVVFASPAFCATEVCGPQVDVLKELKERYKGQANFIHVDFYDNPEEIQGDLSRAVLSPVIAEWRLPSIEWTFVIDKGGVIVGRFEAFATVEELDAALRRVF